VSALFLGVDGGQSSTTAILGDETGRVLGIGRGGPFNHVQASEGRQKFLGAMHESLGAACRAAGLSQLPPLKAACMGFSGGPKDKEALLHEVLTAEHVVVTHDGLIALSGATGGEPGVIIISGTGSFAFGRNGEGRTARAGGWGYAFGDEGGGFHMTRQALRAALRMEEGWGPPTTLRARLLEASGAADANDLLHRFYTTDWPRPKIAALSRLVDEAAVEGDPVASDILVQSAQSLATYAGAVRGQLFDEQETVPVAYIGGGFRSQILLERFRTLMELHDGVRTQAPQYGPAVGALLEAYRAAAVPVRLSNLPESEK